MIRINLTPLEELENPLWWLADAIVVLASCAAAYGIFLFYVARFQEDIQVTITARDALQTQLTAMQPAIKRSQELKMQIDNVKSKVASLKLLHFSKATRFRQLIALEHLQNLRPEGLWFNALTIAPALGRAPAQVSVSGKASDNIIVAEFLTALISTSAQEGDPLDVRSLIYFTNVDLKNSHVSGRGMAASSRQGVPSTASASFGGDTVDFQIEFQHAERDVDSLIPAPMGADQKVGMVSTTTDLAKE